MHTQFLTGKRSEARRLTKQQDLLQSAMIGAKVTADLSQLPQTVWRTNDKDAPYMSLANGSEFKRELKPQPIVTLLPEHYFS